MPERTCSHTRAAVKSPRHKMDDEKKTSLSEELQSSRPGGLIVFVYPKGTADDGN